jgi:hypothetical protein
MFPLLHLGVFADRAHRKNGLGELAFRIVQLRLGAQPLLYLAPRFDPRL